MNFIDWKFHSFAASGYILLWIEKKLFTLVLKQKNCFETKIIITLLTINFDLKKRKQDPKFKTLVFWTTRLIDRTYHSTITIIVIIFRINHAMKLSSTVSSVSTTLSSFYFSIHAEMRFNFDMWELDQTALTTSISLYSILV